MKLAESFAVFPDGGEAIDISAQIPKFLYRFCVWPDETRKFLPAMFRLFEYGGRAEMAFTEQEFRRFRTELASAGLTLREIERVPEVESESVL